MGCLIVSCDNVVFQLSPEPLPTARQEMILKQLATLRQVSGQTVIQLRNGLASTNAVLIFRQDQLQVHASY